MKQGDPKLAVGYLRVSTDEQCLGPQAQRKAIESWCGVNGVVLVAVFEDFGISGAAELDKRPGLLASIDALGDHGAGLLVVAKRDRLARDVVAAGMIERLVAREGAKVVTTDGVGNGESPEAGLVRGIMDVFAQYERALIRARTKAALAVKRSRQERIGGVPYGSKLAADGIHLEVDPAEQETIQAAKGLRSQGMTLEAVGTVLEAKGMLPRCGRHWHPKTVRSLLESREAA